MSPLPIVSSKQLDPAVPFSLECDGCDAGIEIETPEQAAILGWVDVYRDDGPAWNYLGECLACQHEERQREERQCTS